MKTLIVLTTILVSSSAFATITSYCKDEAVSAVKAIHNLNKGKVFNSVHAQADRFLEIDRKQYEVKLYENNEAVQSYKVVVKEEATGKPCKIDSISSLPTY